MTLPMLASLALPTSLDVAFGTLTAQMLSLLPLTIVAEEGPP